MVLLMFRKTLLIILSCLMMMSPLLCDQDKYIKEKGFRIEKDIRSQKDDYAMQDKTGYDVPIENRLSALGFKDSIYTSNEIHMEKEKLKEGIHPTVVSKFPTDYGTLSYLGTTGLIELPNSYVVDRGKISLGTHFLRYRKNVNTVWAHKVTYGIADRTEFGASIVDIEDYSVPTRIFNLKRLFYESDRTRFSILYQYIDPHYQDEGIHNAVGIFDFIIRDYIFITTDIVFSTDAADTVTFNFGMEVMVPGVPEKSTSFIVEFGQDTAQKFSRMNFGLRHRLSDICALDLMRFKNFIGLDDCSGLGINLKF